MVVPDTSGLTPCDLSEQETRFSFPFDNPQKSPEKARTEIEKNLRQLDESTLLFLTNIRKIEYLLPDSTRGFLKRRKTDGNRIEILVQHPEDSESASASFLRFEQTVDINDEDSKPKSCRIAIAFGLEKRDAEITKGGTTLSANPILSARAIALLTKVGRIVVMDIGARKFNAFVSQMVITTKKRKALAGVLTVDRLRDIYNQVFERADKFTQQRMDRPDRVRKIPGREIQYMINEEDAKKSDKRRKQPPTIQWSIKPLEPGQVSIYFPAEKETSNLWFDLHAPFASTVARDSVRACEANDELRDHLVDLIAESMTAIRDQGLLTVGFLATLPNNRDNLSPFYKPILKRLIETFKEEELTPMKQGGHAAANGIFKGPAQLSNLINDNDLATILGEDYSPPMWIANPPQRNQREDNFLSMLDISEWTIKNLIDSLEARQAEQITEWLSGKSENWHERLYSLLGAFLLDDEGYFNNYSYRELFLQLPIVRLSDGTYSKGGDCFFPDEEVKPDQNFPRVAKGVCSSKKFLEAIGVREVGEVEKIEAILKQRYSEDPIKPRKQDMKRFISLVEKQPRRASLFSKYSIFQLERGKYGKPSEVFLDSPYLNTGLRTYYDALNDDHWARRWALSTEYRDSGIDPEKLGEFAKKVGAQTKLEPELQEIPWDHPEKDRLKDDGGWSEVYGINMDYDVREFDLLLARPDLSKSKLVWVTMNELPDELPEVCYCSKSLKAWYRSNSRYATKSANSSLVWKLRTHRWVPQKQTTKGKFSCEKPSDAVAELLPSGFPFDNGAKWLEAIEFGKAERNRKEKERQKEIQATQEHQQKSEAAETLGFSSVEEAQDAERILKEYPGLISRWKTEKQKPTFPERVSPNPERRRKKLTEQHANASEKKYEPRRRSVRVTEATACTRTWLKNQYTNESNQMICQTCKEEMPFKKHDGEYYFEAVEALSKEHFSKGHEAQFLALCPLCAARYKEFVKNDANAMQEMRNKLANSEGIEISLQLGELETSIKFVETHRQDMKTILQNTKL